MNGFGVNCCGGDGCGESGGGGDGCGGFVCEVDDEEDRGGGTAMTVTDETEVGETEERKKVLTNPTNRVQQTENTCVYANV